MPEATNFRFIRTSVDDVFRRAYPFIGAHSDDDFEHRLADRFFRQKTGWTVCGLRPLLPQILGVDVYGDLWGWIDYDVMVSRDAFTKHVAAFADRDMLMVTREGFAWEQFKLFRGIVDLRTPFDKLLAAPAEQSPMEARLSYDLRGLPLTRDGLEQREIAVHWAYSDRSITANQFDVTEVGTEFFDPVGRPVLFFVADTQVKQWTEAEVNAHRAAATKGEATFVYHRQA